MANDPIEVDPHADSSSRVARLGYKATCHAIANPKKVAIVEKSFDIGELIIRLPTYIHIPGRNDTEGKKKKYNWRISSGVWSY